AIAVRDVVGDDVVVNAADIRVAPGHGERVRVVGDSARVVRGQDDAALGRVVVHAVERDEVVRGGTVVVRHEDAVGVAVDDRVHDSGPGCDLQVDAATAVTGVVAVAVLGGVEALV